MMFCINKLVFIFLQLVTHDENKEALWAMNGDMAQGLMVFPLHFTRLLGLL